MESSVPARAVSLAWCPPWHPRPYDQQLQPPLENSKTLDFTRMLKSGVKEGDPDALLYNGWALIKASKKSTADEYAQGVHFITEAQRRGHPGAFSCLGNIQEFGFGCVKDARKAAALYQRGFDQNFHLGCAHALHILAGPAKFNESIARIVKLALRSDVFEIAASTGSQSSLVAVLHIAADTLRDKMRPSWCKSESVESTRLLGLGASLNDTIMMAEYACAVMRKEENGAIGHKSDPLCVSMCLALLANDAAEPRSKSLASSLLGGLEPYNSAKQRARYLFAVEVCGSDIEAIDFMALVCLPMMLFEGLGGPPDYARGLSTVLIGCQRDVGPCLQLEAQRQRKLGNRIAEADLWQRAANRHMPLAMAIVQGISVEDAMRTLPHFSPCFDPALAGRVRLNHGVGKGSSGEGKHGAFAFTISPPAMDVTCDLCKKKGVYKYAADSVAPQPQLPVLLACSACKGALYCSTECQKLAWPSHKAACRAARDKLKSEGIEDAGDSLSGLYANH